MNSNNPSEIAKAVAFNIKDYISDISGEDATIYGPTLDVFGKQFSRFEINASTQINMNNLKTEISYDVENMRQRRAMVTEPTGIIMLNRRMPNGMYGGVRGERKSSLLD